MKFSYNTNFTLPKKALRSRSVLQDGSRSLGLFWNEKKTLSYNEEIPYVNAKQYMQDKGSKMLNKNDMQILHILMVRYLLFIFEQEFLRKQCRSRPDCPKLKVVWSWTTGIGFALQLC